MSAPSATSSEQRPWAAAPGTPASGRARPRGRVLGAIFLVSMLLLAACGVDDDDAADDAVDEDVTDEAPADDDEDVTDDDTDAPDAPPDEVTWRYATPLPQGTSVGDGFEWFAEEVESRTQGAVSWEMFWTGSLLGSADVVAGVRDGQANVGYFTPAYSPADFPLWAMGDIPFVTSNGEASLRAFTRLYEEDDVFRSEFEDQGFYVLHFFPVPPTTVGTSAPVESLADLNGLRIRSIGHLGTALEAAGASAVGLGFEEVYESVDRGVIDGYTQVTFDLGVAASLYEVAPYILHPRLGSGLSVATVINQESWDALSPETQDTIREVADDYIEAAVEILMNAEEAACDALLEDGTATVSVLPQEHAEEWRELAQDEIVEAWVENVVAAGHDEQAARDLFEQYQEYVAEYEAQSAYEVGVERCVERAG